MSLKYLTTKETAEVLGVSETTARVMIASPNGIPYTDIGNNRPRIRVKASDLEAWMASRATTKQQAS